MQIFFKKFFYLLGQDTKTIPLFASLFILLTLLELFSLSILGVLVSLLVNENSENSKLYFLFEFFISFFKNQNAIIVFCIILTLFWFTKTILFIVINNLIVNFSYTAELKLKKIIIKSFKSINYLNFINNQSSTYINYYNRYPSAFRVFYRGSIQFVNDITIAVSILVFLIYLNPFITSLILLVNAAFILFYYNFFLKKLNFFGKQSNLGVKLSTQYLQEFFKSFKEVKILDKQNFFEIKLIQGATSVANGESKISIYNFISRPILEFIYVLFVVLGISFLILSGKNFLSYLPFISIFVVSGLRLIPYIHKFNNFFGSIQSSNHAINSLYDYLIKINDDNKLIKTNFYNYDTFENISFKNINFKYPHTNNYIFKNLTLKLNKNNFIGIVGKSGVGKTTLIDLLLGLVHPNEGSIFINGNEVKNKSKYYYQDWQNKICYLPQDVFISDNTLYTNITLEHSKDNLDMNKIINAIKKSNLYDWYKSLEYGLDTKLGEDGLFISGGQKQRIALARAFYFNKEIIIMDESTNSLDNENEKIIIDEIKKISSEKTVIFISHKIELLKKCDRILQVLNNNLIDYKF